VSPCSLRAGPATARRVPWLLEIKRLGVAEPRFARLGTDDASSSSSPRPQPRNMDEIGIDIQRTVCPIGCLFEKLTQNNLRNRLLVQY
jgi:hypothetical protein